MPVPAILTLNAKLPVTVKEAAQFLEELDSTYKHLRLLEIIQEEVSSQAVFSIHSFWGYLHQEGEIDIPEFYLTPNDSLILARANFNSPGFWEVLGSFNPLQQIREFLNDRHLRKKDADYKNELEKRKLQLENAEIETDILGKQINLLEKIGYSKAQIRKMLNKHYYNPLARLGENADKAEVTMVKVERAPSARLKDSMLD
jgi:hypothetical protein